ncbi:MAG: SMP-30/gluconolactonase/LRE family protein [Chloroflexota bacterium]
MNPTPISNLKVTKVGHSPEDVLPDKDGSVITGLKDGRILRISPDGSISEVANTGGRPLGLDFLHDGRLLVCDTQLGLLAIDPQSGQIETLVAQGTASLHVCNNPAVAEDGRIFFSDSTQQNSENEAPKDIIDMVPTGRLLCRYPDGRVEIVVEELLFANGVIVAPDQSFVLVAQTGKACINRLWLTGDKAGQQDMFATNMPGLPDNLAIGSDGLIWVALVSPFSDLLKRLHSLPYFARYLIARLPQSLQPEQPLFCRLGAYDLDGNLVHLFEGDKDIYHFVTGVREKDGTLYMGTFEGDSIAQFSR